MSKSLSEMSMKELWQLFSIILTERPALCKIFSDEKSFSISHIGSATINGI